MKGIQSRKEEIRLIRNATLLIIVTKILNISRIEPNSHGAQNSVQSSSVTLI